MTTQSPEGLDKAQNEAVATGAVYMALSMHSAVRSAEIDSHNEVVVEFDFLMSPYRITITKEDT